MQRKVSSRRVEAIPYQLQVLERRHRYVVTDVHLLRDHYSIVWQLFRSFYSIIPQIKAKWRQNCFNVTLRYVWLNSIETKTVLPVVYRLEQIFEQILWNIGFNGLYLKPKIMNLLFVESNKKINYSLIAKHLIKTFKPKKVIKLLF